MSPRKQDRRHVNHERWLVSYADFMTLLFAFFVVLYSSSQADKHKMMQLANAIGNAFSKLGVMPGQSVGAPVNKQDARLPAAADAKSGDQDLAQLRRALEQSLFNEIQKRTASVHQGPEGLVISLREVGFYDSGSAEVRPDAKPAFDRIVQVLKNHPCRIRVEGHTDNVPIHTRQFNSNWELSTARATAVIREFVVVYGIEARRLSAAGYGEFHPIAPNDTEEGRRLNRRLDIVILPASPPQPETSNSAPLPKNSQEQLARRR